MPKQWGDWVFYYANPKTGGRLSAVNHNEHKDPATGEIFKDKKIVDAYRTILHNRANRAALNLGWAYAYTGNDAPKPKNKRTRFSCSKAKADFAWRPLSPLRG